MDVFLLSLHGFTLSFFVPFISQTSSMASAPPADIFEVLCGIEYFLFCIWPELIDWRRVWETTEHLWLDAFSLPWTPCLGTSLCSIRVTIYEVSGMSCSCVWRGLRTLAQESCDLIWDDKEAEISFETTDRQQAWPTYFAFPKDKHSPANTTAFIAQAAQQRKSKTRTPTPGTVPCRDRKRTFLKPQGGKFYLAAEHSHFVQTFCIAAIPWRPAHLRKGGGRNAWGGRLASGFCTASIMKLWRHESPVGSRGAELWSLHDRHPQRHNLRWIGISEKDSYEQCHTYTDGTVITVKQLWPAWMREWRMCAQGDKIHPQSWEKYTYSDFRHMSYQR